MMISGHVLIIVLMLVTAHSRKSTTSKATGGLRIYQGTDDDTNKYPYVVSIQPLRICTGTLIAANWVLTAAHCCIEEVKMIQYGNLSIPLGLTESKSMVLKMIQYPQYRGSVLKPNDIGLMLVNPVNMDKFASVSAVDYSVLQGASVEYAGFGYSFLPKTKTRGNKISLLISFFKPLQIAQAVVRPCTSWFKGFICVSPKCSITQLSTPGDSGGPLFMDDKIVGLVTATLDDGFQNTDRYFTPISPHIAWIQSTITKRTDKVKRS